MATSENYLPSPPPIEASAALRQWLDEEHAKIAEILNLGHFCLPTLTEEPAKPENGTIVYADGTSWNPGSGEGFYGYENGAWVKL